MYIIYTSIIHLLFYYSLILIYIYIYNNVYKSKNYDDLGFRTKLIELKQKIVSRRIIGIYILCIF